MAFMFEFTISRNLVNIPIGDTSWSGFFVFLYQQKVCQDGSKKTTLNLSIG